MMVAYTSDFVENFESVKASMAIHLIGKRPFLAE